MSKRKGLREQRGWREEKARCSAKLPLSFGVDEGCRRRNQLFPTVDFPVVHYFLIYDSLTADGCSVFVSVRIQLEYSSSSVNAQRANDNIDLSESSYYNVVYCAKQAEFQGRYLQLPARASAALAGSSLFAVGATGRGESAFVDSS